jgi:hypothetical protein
MDPLDEMTLRLICNKSLYNKYIEQTEPETHKKKKAFLSKVQKYKGKMLDLTREFLLNPEKEYSVAVNEMFEQYCQTLIYYLEHKELDEKYGGDYENDPTEESDGESDVDSESRSEVSSEDEAKGTFGSAKGTFGSAKGTAKGTNSEDLSRTPEFSDMFAAMRIPSSKKGKQNANKQSAVKKSSAKKRQTTF